jgi:diguanylate cyclase (GGDEF)-like protein/PAS domain S-box-containing protein
MFGTGNNFATQYPQIWAKVSSQNSGQIEDEFGVFTFSSVYPSAHVVAGIKKPSHDEKLKSHTQFTNFDQNQSVWKVMSLVEAQRMVPYPFDANNSPLLWVLSGMLVLSTLGSWQMARLSVIRKKNEASLRVLSQAVEQNPSMVLITDKDGGIEYVNLRFCKTTGYEKAEIIGQNPNVLNAQNMTAEDYETMWKDITQGKNWAGDMFDKRKDGSNYWASSHISPIRDAKGEITHFIGMQQDITEEKALREELERMARTDALTGIYNRRHFYELVDTEVQRCRRYKRPLAVMMIDLDFFKQVNDSYGHLAGDICLVSFVNFVSEALRTTDIFARFGGEEFIIALPDTSLDAATNLAERLRERISELDVVFNEQTISISVSVGLSEWGNNEETLQETISRADMALYQAKKNGRNRVEVTNAT